LFIAVRRPRVPAELKLSRAHVSVGGEEKEKTSAARGALHLVSDPLNGKESLETPVAI
jgi:hypothetical protein